MISASERAFSQSLVALVLGIDQVYRGLLPPDVTGLAAEGYVAINLSEVPAMEIATYREAAAKAEELKRRLSGLDLALDRHRYFADYLASICTFLRWQQMEGEISYGSLVVGLLGVPGEPPQQAPLLAGVRDLLEQAGYRGDLPDMLGEFEEERAVPPDRVKETLERYLADARSITSERLFPLPGDLQFSVEVVSGAPYNAYCDYVGRVVRINGDVPHTHEGLKHLACHEAYPGHSTHIWRREQLWRQGEMTEDGLLVVTDTPTSPLFEGIGEFGLTLVGWNRTIEERIAIAAMRLRSGLGAFAGRLTAEGAHEQARQLLERYGGAAWADARMRFLDLPLRRPFIFAYHLGDLLVHRVHEHAEDRRAFLAGLYDRMHSPASLELMFQERGL